MYQDIATYHSSRNDLSFSKNTIYLYEGKVYIYLNNSVQRVVILNETFKINITSLHSLVEIEDYSLYQKLLKINSTVIEIFNGTKWISVTENVKNISRPLNTSLVIT